LVIGGVGVVGLLAISFAVLSTTMHFASASELQRRVEVNCRPVHIPVDDPAALARGEYLVKNVMGCMHCHGEDLGGFAVVDEWPMGRIYGPNITMGEGSVVREFEPVDWVRVIRHGVTKDGRRALLMPSQDWWNFSDADLGAAIAYVKSVPPVDRPRVTSSLAILGKMLVATGEVPFSYDLLDHSAGRPEAEPGPTREWGEVMVGACIGCHGHGLSGGKIPGAPPSWPAAANITTHEEQGIGKWSREDFFTLLRKGKRPDGRQLGEPMVGPAGSFFAGLTDDDVTALWEYLRTVPAKNTGGR
jgi:mono/diheme cytochrome c family protein